MSKNLVFFRSEPKTVDFASGKLKKQVQRQIDWGAKDGEMYLTATITDEGNEKPIAVLEASSICAADPILGFRAAKVLEAMTSLEELSVIQAMAVAGWHTFQGTDSELDGESANNGEELFDELAQTIGEQALSALCTSIPDNLQTMVTQLRDSDISFERTGMIMEAGRGLKITPFYRELGVDTKAALEERHNRLTDKAIDLAPLFMKYLRQNGHSIGCSHETRLIKYAVQCLERGIDDTGELVTLSICLLHDGANEVSEAAKRLASAVASSFFGGAEVKEVFTSENPDQKYDPEVTMMKVAGWVGERTDNNPKHLADAVRNYRAKWKKLPIKAK